MVKKVTKKTNTTEEPKLDVNREAIILGHLIKYNLYLLTKSIIFSSLLQQSGDVEKSITEANRVVGELDLDTKKKLEQQN